MAGTRIFDVSIVSGTSHSLYTIYYDAVNASNIATIVSTSNPATGVTYNDLTSGGVRVQVPDTASTILLYNDSCLVDDQIILPTPTPTPSPTPSSTPTPTPTATPNCDFGIDTIVTTPTPTPSPSPTNTPTPTGTPTPTPTATPNCDFGIDTVVTTPTPTPSPSPTNTPTPSPTTSPTPTPSPSPSPTETPTPTPSPTTSPTPTPTGTPTPTPTATPNCDFGVDVDINLAPTGFTPALLTQTENTATGTTIATLSAGDPDSGNTHTFSLVSGSGSTDNGSFTLSSAGVLKNAVVFDYETKNSYSIRVRVTDQGGLYHEEIRTVSVTNVNETPYGLTLSNNTQNENTTTGTTIGTFTGLDYDPLETFTYSLIDPGGNSDESKFTLSSAGVLKNAIEFDYETKNSYTITVRVTDSANNYYEDDFTININDVNEAPTSLSLSSNTIQENKVTGTTIGTFSANDPDATETLSYELVSGLGDTNNGSFNLTTGGTLTSAEVFDRETKSSYSIRVKVTDKGNLTYTGIFTIIVTNQNEAPYGLTLSSNTIQENKVTGTTIGTFTALDYDSGDTFTFALSGTGNDNNSFILSSGGTLSSAEVFNYEVKNSYTIGVTVTDSGGLTYTDTFDISVTDVNETPTDIGLSNSSILENQSSGTTVGTFSTTDPDANNTFTYTLVTGTGSNDNTSFIIDGSTLKSAAIFDYETKNSYSIRVRSTDQGNEIVEKVISISVTNQNERPGLISPTSVSFAENQDIGTTITTFSSTDPDANTTLTWTLVSGSGDTDNGTFVLSTGGTLTSTVVHNYEVKNSYSIRVQVSDGSLTRTQIVTINITNVNETPTDISLSNSSVPENSSTGTTVGTFTTTDPDANNTFTYTLVTGTGDTDNASFYVTGVSSTAAVLKTSETFNYEVKNSYSIRVRSTDQGGEIVEETFTITVTNVNETPTNIALSNSSVDENLPTGTTVGTLSTTDPDANNTFTYTLVTGTGSNDNTSFYIDGDVIKTSETFDYETKSTYKCRVRSTDQGGEWFEKAFTITITNITVSGGVSVTNPSCNGLNGTITVTGTTGGSSPYTYSTDAINYQTSTSFSRAAGSYTIFIKDSNDEVGAVFATITEPPLLSISIQDFTIPSCSYEDDGVITVTATGGTGNLEYSIDGGTTYVTGTTFTGLTNGTYTIRVVDSLGCAKTVSQSLNRTAITSTISTTNLDCNGDGSGEISVGTPSGGTGTGYKVKLNSGGTYETVTSWPKVYSSLAAGTYHIFIKDSNECEFMFTRVITQPSVLNIAEDSKTYPNCWNSTNGALSVTASGGTTPYTYSLDDVTYQSSASFTGLTEGVYLVRVKDNKGCKDTVSIDISRDPVAATINTTGTTCNGYSDGAISVTNGSGGTGTGYEVKLNSGSYATVPQTYTGLTAGSYTITVKDSLGCTTTYSPTVSQPASVSVSTTFTNPTCSSDTNGSITVTASGGNGSYEYSINGGDYQTSNQFTNLGTGTYTLTVRDGNGCTGSNTRTLTKTSVSSAISITGVTCNGGTNGRIVAATPSGGNGPTYQYRWQGGSWTTFNSSVTFSNLSAGTYTFEVKDVSGCTTTYSPIVSQPTAVVASASVTHPTCWNGTGSVTLSASGGTGSKVYSIDGVNYYVSGTFTSLSTGNYTGYAKDATQCVDTVSFSLTKSMPSATVTQTNIACNGDGTGTITVSNPTGGNGGGTFSNYDVKLNSGSWISFSSTSYQFTGLNGGVHNIYIRDNSDCISNAIGVYITEPSAVNVAVVSGTSPTCDGGSDGTLTWSRSGGTSPYTYTLNGSEVTSLTATGLTEGTYTFVVTDANGCTDSVIASLDKTPVSVSTSQSNATCSGGNGSITVNSISGGNGGTYRHRLNSGSWITTLPYTYSSLPASSYTIYVEDGVGCQNYYIRTISQPSSVTFTTSSSAPTCYDGSNGSISVTASGGNGSYQYQINSGTWQSSNTFSSLSNGTYLIRVRDTNLCYSSVSSITLNKTAPSATFSSSSTSCFGGSDGSITITNATGGDGGAMQSYQHKLNSGTYAYFQSTSYTYSNLSGGSKTIWIKDSSGCEKSYTVTVPQPSALTVTVTNSTNGPNGSLTVTSAGGTWNKTYRLYQDTTSPYTVGGGSLVATIPNVTSSNPSQTFSNLAGGYYYVIVTDANGCTASTTIQDLTESAPAEAVYQITSCTNGTVYWASVQNFCIDGILSMAALNYNIGQIVQFSVGVDCPNPEGSTYCGTITGQGVQSPTAIITNEGAMNSCDDFRCFE